ncbi:MAG: hypothetical protein RIE08_03710 [Acidimicrobiales bacterium]
MGRKYESTQQFDASPDSVWEALGPVVDAAGFRVTDSDDDARTLHGRKRKGDIATGNVIVPGGRIGRTAPARKTFGEKLAVSVGAGSNGRTSVNVESRLVFGLIDWGENKKNVDRVFGLLGTRLTAES